MKYIFAIVIASLFSVLTKAQDSSFTVKGTVKGLNSTKIYITMYTTSNTVKRDSVLVQNESFVYTGFVKSAGYVTMSPNMDNLRKKVGKGYIPVKSSMLQFFAEPGATITFNGAISNFVEAYPSGTITNNSMAELCQKINPIQNESADLNIVLFNTREETNKIDNKLLKKITKLNSEIKKRKETFLKSNINNNVSTWLLSDMLMRRELTEKEVKEYFDKMDNTLWAGNNYYNEVSSKLNAATLTQNGNSIPNIVSANTYDGKPFDLASLKGKYVIVDFWGTWCGPCVNGMPEMAKYYKKYSDKLQIVSIAKEGDNGEKWKAFIQEHPDYNWIHLLDDKAGGFTQQFNINAFPTKYIIDPEGKIVDKIIGEGKLFYRKLNKLLR